jgi:hypothetical protein
MGTTRIGADFGSFHSSLGTSLRSAPLRAEPSVPASKIGLPPFPNHFNLERSTLINYPLIAPHHYSLFQLLSGRRSGSTSYNDEYIFNFEISVDNVIPQLRDKVRNYDHILFLTKEIFKND